MHSAHKRKWSLTEDAYLNFNPRTDAIYSQGIKKKIDIKISRPRKDYRESFAPCTGNGHQQYSRSTTRLCALLRGQVPSPGDGWMHRQMVCSRLEVFPQTDALFQENNVISG